MAKVHGGAHPFVLQYHDASQWIPATRIREHKFRGMDGTDIESVILAEVGIHGMNRLRM